MVEAKLVKILTSLDSINKRLDTIESKLDLFSKRMDNIETNFDRMNERFDDFEEKQKLENKTFTEALDSKISKNDFDKLGKRMDYIFDQDRKQHLMIHLVDVRRLPRHPISFRGKQITRLIIKLLNVFEKKKIMDSLPKFKAYNQKRGKLATSNLSIFISEHLPKEF